MATDQIVIFTIVIYTVFGKLAYTSLNQDLLE